MFEVFRRRYIRIMDAIASTNAACAGVARSVEEGNDRVQATVNELDEELETKADMLADELMKLRESVDRLRAEGAVIEAQLTALTQHNRQSAESQTDAVNKTLAQLGESAAQAFRNAQ
jgi:uncharacterized protein YoxC